MNTNISKRCVSIDKVSLPNFHLWFPYWQISGFNRTNLRSHIFKSSWSEPILMPYFASNLKLSRKSIRRQCVISIGDTTCPPKNIIRLPLCPSLSFERLNRILPEIIIRRFKPIRIFFTNFPTDKPTHTQDAQPFAFFI